MKNTQTTYPLQYRLLNTLGRSIQGLNPSFLSFDQETLLKKAVKNTGLTDFGYPHYAEGLQQLLDSLEHDANLHPIGRITAHMLVDTYLKQRLRFVESLNTQPQIYQQPLIPPVIVTGMARSGTSFLHRMLAMDPGHRALPQWQLMFPYPENSTDPSAPDRRKHKMQRSLRFREPLVTGIDAIHFTRAETPEECIVALGLTFNSLIFSTLFPVTGYTQWYLEEKDNSQKYQEYRWLLQHYQSEKPDQRLVLKTPGHTGNLKEIKQSIPQAMLIQTHRDPATCISSVCSLVYTFYGSVSSKIDKLRVGKDTMDLYETWFKRNIAFREENPGAVYDVYYRSLVADPIGTVRDIYAHYDIPWTQEYQMALEKYINENPKNKHGKHEYLPSEFGLDKTEINQQFKFYSDYVGLED